MNTANTQNTTISFSSTVRSTLSRVSHAPLHIRAVLPGVISSTLITKSASLILLEAPCVRDTNHVHIDRKTIKLRNIFFIAIKRE
jgi:hypothetical protein